MSLSVREVALINKAIKALEKMVAQNGRSKRRVRRSGKELVAFRKMLLAERKKGVPVATLAKKHGISRTYIYLL